MESHPEYGFVHTKALQYIQEQNAFSSITIGTNASNFEELLRRNTICTLTVLIRLELISQYRTEIKPAQYNWKMGDYPMWLYCSSRKKMHFMPEITGVYRVLPTSMSHSLDIQKRLEFLYSVGDIRMFFAEREGVSIALKNTILRELRVDEICMLSTDSPKKAYYRLKESKNLTIKQKIYLYLKILQKIIIK